MERGLDEVRIHPFLYDVRQGAKNQVLDLPCPVCLGSPKPHDKDGLPKVPLESRHRGQILPQLGIDEGLPQGTGGATHEDTGENLQQEGGHAFRVLRQHPDHVDHGAPAGIFVFGDGQIPADGSGGAPPGLGGNGRVNGYGLEAGEGLFQEGQVFRRSDVAVQEDTRVGWRIVGPVKGAKILVGQGGDDFGRPA